MQKGTKSHIITAPALALLATLLTALPGWGAADSTHQRPRLVLGIVVDGLRSDYLELLSDHFGPDGFNKLIENGLVLDRVSYGPAIDAAGAVAMLYTGAEPAVNGIATSTTYDTERHLDLPTLLDPEQLGNYTTETLSPAAIRVSTLADELRIDGGGAAYAHAIAPDATRAIIMAGHAGNSAFWINDANGRWATTTHYRDVPPAISSRNHLNPLSQRIDTMRWSPSMDLSLYPGLPEHKRHYGFMHTFSGNAADKYSLFKTSAPANTELTDLAEEYIRTLQLGSRDAMDFLSVAYSLSPFAGSTDPEARLETMDAYLRLDRDLARLLKTAEETGSTMVLLAGTPERPDGYEDDAKWKLPFSHFSTRKAASLLNLYLIAHHGNGDWLTDYHNGAFYFNRQLIESKGINAEDFRTDAAKFLMRMAGVAGAYTIDDILEGRTSEALKRNTVVSTAPDVYLNITPGWVVLDDYASAADATRTTVRIAATEAPAILYYPPRVPSGRITDEIDARRIAPTVSRVLRIRSPNASAQPPIPEAFTVRKPK